MNLPYYTYGILMTLAFIVGVLLYLNNCKKLNINKLSFWELGTIVPFFGVIGARIAYILIFPEQFDGLRDYLALHEGGFVFYGGFFAVIVTLFFYTKIKRYQFEVLCDFMAPSLALGHSIGRIGCYINDCCYGAKTDIIKIYQIKGETFYRHPTQLYESFALFIAAFFINHLLKKEYTREKVTCGFVACCYLCFYSIFRFLIEYLRDDNRGGFYTFLHLSPSQVISLFILFITVIIIATIKKIK